MAHLADTYRGAVYQRVKERAVAHAVDFQLPWGRMTTASEGDSDVE